MVVAPRFDEIRMQLGGTVAVREERGLAVVSPRNTEEVAALLRRCNAAGWRVEVAGAGTKRGWAGLVEADVVLEVGGLSGVREHSWQDLTATVGAGTTWGEMQRVLRAHGQMVALDPLWPERATVGGILAANDSGAWRLRYGSARDLVIGMTIVLADGTIAKSGGKVVKNVAGYDLHKLMLGAFGTLGVITEVTFRLHPVPVAAEVWSFRSENLDALGSLMMRVLGSLLGVHAMQLRTLARNSSLDVELTGGREVLAEHVATLRGLSGGAANFARGETDAFGARERLLQYASSSVLKITMLPSAIASISAVVVRARGEAVAQASGIMMASLPDSVDKEMLQEICSLAKSSGGGTVSVLRGDGGPTLPDASVFTLMREIKQRFDPERILNRRLMGGV